MVITCDKCNYEFHPTNNMLLEHRMADGLIEVYYMCPKCKAKFHVCYHNAETKRLQKLIKRAENTNKAERTKELKKKLKYEMDKLNNRL